MAKRKVKTDSDETTNDTDKMLLLGLNPGMISHYQSVSVQPVYFRNVLDPGSCGQWRAVHSYRTANGGEGEAGGFIVRTNTQDNRPALLMKLWEQTCLDTSFIKTLKLDQIDAALVRVVIRLAKTLELSLDRADLVDQAARKSL